MHPTSDEHVYVDAIDHRVYDTNDDVRDSEIFVEIDLTTEEQGEDDRVQNIIIPASEVTGNATETMICPSSIGDINYHYHHHQQQHLTSSVGFCCSVFPTFIDLGRSDDDDGTASSSNDDDSSNNTIDASSTAANKNDDDGDDDRGGIDMKNEYCSSKNASTTTTSASAKFRQYIRILFKWTLLLCLIGFAVITVGMEWEQFQVRRMKNSEISSLSSLTSSSSSSSTTTSNSVCAVVYNGIEATLSFVTRSRNIVNVVNTMEAATTIPPTINDNEDNDHRISEVAHCGDCGSCSNPHDVQIYETNDALYTSIFHQCARKGIIGGGQKATKLCIEEQVGFTHSCTDCWATNMECNVQSCAFSCLYDAIFASSSPGTSGEESSFIPWSEGGNDNTDSASGTTRINSLNRCTACSKYRCGPRFVRCAGVTGRQTIGGIVSTDSDVDDNDADNNQDVCQLRTSEWWTKPWIQDAWDRQQEQQQEQEQRDSQPSAIDTVLESHGSTPPPKTLRRRRHRR